VRSSLTTLVVLVTVIHVAAFAVWAAIRLWPDKARGRAGQGVAVRPTDHTTQAAIARSGDCLGLS
jgi:hypothetical protein